VAEEAKLDSIASHRVGASIAAALMFAKCARGAQCLTPAGASPMRGFGAKRGAN
jgi:hypothetical protein